MRPRGGDAALLRRAVLAAVAGAGAFPVIPPAGLRELIGFSMFTQKNLSAHGSHGVRKTKVEGRILLYNLGCTGPTEKPTCKSALSFTEMPSTFYCIDDHNDDPNVDVEDAGTCMAANDPTFMQRMTHDMIVSPVVVEWDFKRSNARYSARQSDMPTLVDLKVQLATALFDQPASLPRGHDGKSTYGFETDLRHWEVGVPTGGHKGMRVHGVGWMGDGEREAAKVEHARRAPGDVVSTQHFRSPPADENWKVYQYRCPLKGTEHPHQVRGHHIVAATPAGETKYADYEVKQPIDHEPPPMYGPNPIETRKSMAKEHLTREGGDLNKEFSKPLPKMGFHHKIHMYKLDPNTAPLDRHAKTLDQFLAGKGSKQDMVDLAAIKDANRPRNMSVEDIKRESYIALERAIPSLEHVNDDAKYVLNSSELQDICNISKHSSQEDFVQTMAEMVAEILSELPTKQTKIQAMVYVMSSCIKTEFAQWSFVQTFIRSGIFRHTEKIATHVLTILATLRPVYPITVETAVDLAIDVVNHPLEDTTSQLAWFGAAGICHDRPEDPASVAYCERFENAIIQMMDRSEAIADAQTKKYNDEEGPNHWEEIHMMVALIVNMGGCDHLDRVERYTREKYPAVFRTMATRALRRMPCRGAEKVLTHLAHPSETYANHTRIQEQALGEMGQRVLSSEGVEGLRNAWDAHNALIHKKHKDFNDNEYINVHHATIKDFTRVASMYPSHAAARHVSRSWLTRAFDERGKYVLDTSAEPMAAADASALLDALMNNTGAGRVSMHGGIHDGASFTQKEWQQYVHGPGRNFDCRGDSRGAVASVPVSPVRARARLPDALEDDKLACLDEALGATLLVSHGGHKEEAFHKDSGVGDVVAVALTNGVEIILTDKGKGNEIMRPPAPHRHAPGILEADTLYLQAGETVRWRGSASASILLGHCDDPKPAAVLIARYVNEADWGQSQHALAAMMHKDQCVNRGCKEQWNRKGVPDQDWVATGRMILDQCKTTEGSWLEPGNRDAGIHLQR